MKNSIFTSAITLAVLLSATPIDFASAQEKRSADRARQAVWQPAKGWCCLKPGWEMDRLARAS